LNLNSFLDAADHGDLGKLRTGLASGLGVNDVDAQGWTALLTAARAGQLEAVQFLLNAGADPSVERPGGFGPLHLLIEAAKSGLQPDHLRIADALLGAGASPDQQTSKGKQTPVRNAAALGLSPMLRLLLAAQADVDLRDKDKATPLYAAADGGADAAVRLLLEAGADSSLTDRYGRTPLHAAAIVGSAVVCRVLLDAGADPTVVTRFPVDRLRAKSTALQAAELMGHADIAALLANAAAPSQATQAPWPDADGADADWLSRVLLGKKDYPTTRDDHHVLDALLRAWKSGDEQTRLSTGFRGLLTHSNVRLRSAAVHFYVKFLVPDDGAVHRAWSEHPELYRGVRTEWYPEDADLAGLLTSTLSRYSIDSTSARDLVRDQALRPGHGQDAVAGLLASDRDWLLSNIVTIVDGSPEALPVVLGSARLRGLVPEDIMRRLLGKIPDEVLLAGIRGSLPDWREWLDEVVAQAAAAAPPPPEPTSPIDEHRRLIGSLLDHDASEVFDKLEQLLDTAPSLGEALLLEMASRKMDLRGAISLLRDRAERDDLKSWILGAVTDELERLVYLAMI
jgi:ankyrin repeat protein